MGQTKEKATSSNLCYPTACVSIIIMQLYNLL